MAEQKSGAETKARLYGWLRQELLGIDISTVGLPLAKEMPPRETKYLYAFASLPVASALSSTRSLRLISLSSLFMVIVLCAN